MTKPTREQLDYMKREIADFVDKQFPKRPEGHPEKGERGVAIVALTLFIHHLRAQAEK